MAPIVLQNREDQIKRFGTVRQGIFVHGDCITLLVQGITFVHHPVVVENYERMNITPFIGILGNIFQKQNLTT